MENGARRAALRICLHATQEGCLGGVSRQAATEPGCYLFRQTENILQLLHIGVAEERK